MSYSHSEASRFYLDRQVCRTIDLSSLFKRLAFPLGLACNNRSAEAIQASRGDLPYPAMFRYIAAYSTGTPPYSKYLYLKLVYPTTNPLLS